MSNRRRFLRVALLAQLVAATLNLPFGLSAKAASLAQIGPSTGLPLPRYVSLKSDKVNLREGPSQDHPPTWVFQRAGLPVEVTAEFDIWRKIRDADGDEGWVIQSLLSGRRTVLVKPWAKDEILPLFDKPDAKSALDARLQSGVVADVKACDRSWCHIYGPRFDGWMPQVELWGVYPNEKVD